VLHWLERAQRSPLPSANDHDVAIDVADLRKSYGGLEAVRGISLTIRRGETYALLGPNGAGKTSTIEILEGYRRRDSGMVRVLGMDPGADQRAFRQRIGIVLQSTALEPELTVRETARAFASLYPKPLAVDEVLDMVDLTSKRDQRVRSLSGGQQRRLDIALGLLGNPEVIFLDEPTTGLDPEARRKIWQLIGALTERGRTILLSSHHMEEVDALADRIAIMVAGRICAEGTPQDLQEAFGGLTEIRFGLDLTELPDTYPAPLRPVSTFRRGMVLIKVLNPTPILADITNWSFRQRITLRNLTVTRPTLEDIYLDLTRTHSAAAESRENPAE